MHYLGLYRRLNSEFGGDNLGVLFDSSREATVFLGSIYPDSWPWGDTIYRKLTLRSLEYYSLLFQQSSTVTSLPWELAEGHPPLSEAGFPKIILYEAYNSRAVVLVIHEHLSITDISLDDSIGFSITCNSVWSYHGINDPGGRTGDAIIM